jgi:hypothetical protein
MSGTQLSNDTATEPAGAVALPTRLEVVVVPVADVERAKASTRQLERRRGVGLRDVAVVPA